MKSQLIFVVTLVAFVAAERKSYSGYKVYEIQATDDEQFKILESIRKRMDFWKFSGTTEQKSVVMVNPIQIEETNALLKKHQINYHVLIEDLEKIFETERQQQLSATKNALGRISFDAYHRHGVINNYLDELAKKFPKLVKVEDVGRSYENRTLKTILISSGGNGKKPLVFIDACIHAREWSTPAFALYIINQLVENNSNTSDFLKNADWLILPVVNPDGYEYTHLYDRLWRKTRSPTSNRNCTGVDGNRNYDFNWMAQGGNDNPCDNEYSGPKAASEPEIRAVSNILLKNKDRIKLYISLHTYGNWLLTPYGHTKDTPSNYKELEQLGRNVSDAITAATGSKYTVGSFANNLYYASGISSDYAYGAAGVKLSYTWELPEGGTSGFEYPPEKIDYMVKETFVGLKAFSKYINEHF